LWAIATSGHLHPGEDAVEPIALLAAPFGINLLYTLGWLVEVPARLLRPGLSPRFGQLLLKMGHRPVVLSARELSSPPNRNMRPGVELASRNTKVMDINQRP